MPTAEEQTWAGSATGRKPGAKAEETSWTSILAPGNRGDGRTSWVSERGKGAEPAVDDDEFEVESAMLAPLAELQDRKLTGCAISHVLCVREPPCRHDEGHLSGLRLLRRGWSSGGRWRAAARRKRNAAFVMVRPAYVFQTALVVLQTASQGRINLLGSLTSTRFGSCRGQDLWWWCS